MTKVFPVQRTDHGLARDMAAGSWPRMGVRSAGGGFKGTGSGFSRSAMRCYDPPVRSGWSTSDPGRSAGKPIGGRRVGR